MPSVPGRLTPLPKGLSWLDRSRAGPGPGLPGDDPQGGATHRDAEREAGGSDTAAWRWTPQLLHEQAVFIKSAEDRCRKPVLAYSASPAWFREAHIEQARCRIPQ